MGAFLLGFLGFLIYFLPSILARGKSFFMQVFLLNLLLGWTFVGWVIALVWAVKKESK